MAPRPRWPSEALDALSRLGAHDRAGLAAFRERFPEISPEAIRVKLMTLRIRGVAADVDHTAQGSPFPAYRFD